MSLKKSLLTNILRLSYILLRLRIAQLRCNLKMWKGSAQGCRLRAAAYPRVAKYGFQGVA